MVTIVEDLDVRSRHLPDDVDPSALDDIVLGGEFRTKTSTSRELADDIAAAVRKATEEAVAETLREHGHVDEEDGER